MVAGAEDLTKKTKARAKLPKPSVPTPVFEPVNFTQADFEKLLANDEPYIPAARHRKRKPSSTLSIKEREQGLTKQLDEHRSGSKHSTQTKKPSRHQSKQVDGVTDIEPKLVENQAKPKRTRRRKSNAKPKADSI